MKKNYQGVKLAGNSWRVNPFIRSDSWKGAIKSVKNLGATGFEPATSWSQTKRSTKLSYAPERVKLEECLRLRKKRLEN